MSDAYLMLAVAEGFGESPAAAILRPDVDPDAVLAAPPAPPDVPPRVARQLQRPDLASRAAAIHRRAEDLGLRVMTPRDHDWPVRMSEQPVAPLVLFVRGDPCALTRAPAAALVGSRTPTPYGIDAASELARSLADAGTVLWSGLARGVDRLAHEAAVRGGMPTVAVLAGGLDRVYPGEHVGLADAIVAGGGALISELPPGRRARRGHFIRRNRLLAAGPRAVVVVEGSLASGALHTARFAADCDTDVFAVPGPWQSERSQGCHRLIAEGAGIVESPGALLQALGLGAAEARTATHCQLRAEERAILTQLTAGPRPGDLLQREAGLDRAAFLRALFGLQQRQRITRLPGDLWRAVGR
ncbi:MAG TPA: DNA-protecting protein DprA [bacterium]|nr:DNA-protecting protein DprA [bacterium]